MFLESERLVIRKVKISDAPFYFTLFNDKDWIQFIYDKNLNSVEETEVYLKELITKNLKNKDLVSRGFFLCKLSGLSVNVNQIELKVII